MVQPEDQSLFPRRSQDTLPSYGERHLETGRDHGTILNGHESNGRRQYKEFKVEGEAVEGCGFLVSGCWWLSGSVSSASRRFVWGFTAEARRRGVRGAETRNCHRSLRDDLRSNRLEFELIRTVEAVVDTHGMIRISTPVELPRGSAAFWRPFSRRLRRWRLRPPPCSANPLSLSTGAVRKRIRHGRAFSRTSSPHPISILRPVSFQAPSCARACRCRGRLGKESRIPNSEF